MSVPTDYRRVTRRSPCQVCGKSDWCLSSKDGTKAICPRVPSAHPAGLAGYLHSLDGNPVHYRSEKPEKPVEINAGLIHAHHREAITGDELQTLAESLGVTGSSLWNLGVGRAVEWCEGTYSFPMRDGAGKVIGLRLRNIEGHKWAVYGSKNGLFYDIDLEIPHEVYVCEGPTSAAALMDLGFYAIGRPSNSSGTEYLKTMLSHMKPDVVIVSEMDGKPTCTVCTDNYCLLCHPGQVGADKAADALKDVAKSVKVIEPLVGKDIRQWLQHGATKSSVLAVVKNTPRKA